MGFAEIQAAFAAQGAPASPTAVQAVPTPAFAPSPFNPPTLAAPPVTAAFPAFVPPVVAPPAPVQLAFTFTPPAGAAAGPVATPGQPWPPINPPGERAALAAPISGPIVTSPFQVVAEASAAIVSEPPPEAPKAKRGRKPKDAMVVVGPALTVTEFDDLVEKAGRAYAAPAETPSLAAEGAAIALLPADGSTVEDIVQELFARGASSVHLTFTKDGS